MTVWVDDVEHPFGRMLMCHLWADSLEELLAFVDRLGVDRKWIQGHPTLSLPAARKASWVHFDISKSKKAKALFHGAVLTDRYGPALHVARLRHNQTMVNNIIELRRRAGKDLKTGMISNEVFNDP